MYLMIFFYFVEYAPLLPKNTFIIARNEFAVPTEVKVFLGHSIKIVIVGNHCQMAYLSVTTLRVQFTE